MPQLLYTLRPAADDLDLGDQDDATFYNTSLGLPTTRRLGFAAPVADTHSDDTALITHLVLVGRARINTPPNATFYSNAELYCGYETGEELIFSVPMYDSNAFADRTSSVIPLSPYGTEWNLADVLSLFVGAFVTMQKLNGQPNPSFDLSELRLEVWGTPSEQCSLERFKDGIFALSIDGAPYISHLLAAEAEDIYTKSTALDALTSFGVVAYDDGSIGGTATLNSTYAGMLDAITAAAGGSQLPEDM